MLPTSFCSVNVKMMGELFLRNFQFNNSLQSIYVCFRGDRKVKRLEKSELKNTKVQKYTNQKVQ